ncbi:NUDIX hydrolase [Streptomyces sp. NPDC127049]|uniref:NUDIX hydrolase n=1 Tax=Streptomyces sp. NPDC127049 TaxID=3347118 RepID=UPI00365CA4B9
MTDTNDSPLLLQRPAYVGKGWQLPGGLADHGEHPLTTTLREVADETGLALDHSLPLLTVEFMRAGPDEPLADPSRSPACHVGPRNRRSRLDGVVGPGEANPATAPVVIRI